MGEAEIREYPPRRGRRETDAVFGTLHVLGRQGMDRIDVLTRGEGDDPRIPLESLRRDLEACKTKDNKAASRRTRS